MAITKTQLLNHLAPDPEARLLLGRMMDRKDQAEARDTLTQTGFLSPQEQALAEALLKQLPPTPHLFSGGYDQAERQLCVFLPSWMGEEELPPGVLAALEVQVPPLSALNHRDYLGSLMGLGLTREKIGDILLTSQGAQVEVLAEAKDILLDQWDKVGRYPIRLWEIPLENLSPAPPTLERRRDTVSSLRLDAVAAAGFNLSRSKAAELIAAGKLMKNHRPCEKTDAPVAQGDVISCRGFGKFVLTTVGGISKKGRIILEMDRYV